MRRGTPDVTTVWRWSGDGVVALHSAYLAYLLVGGFVAWRWPKTIVPHALAALWAVLMMATPVDCPLTTLQQEFRRLAGQAPLHGGSSRSTSWADSIQPIALT